MFKQLYSIKKEKVLFTILMLLPSITFAGGMWDATIGIYWSKVYPALMAISVFAAVAGLVAALFKQDTLARVMVGVTLILAVAGNLPGGIKYVGDQFKQRIIN